MTAFDIKKFSEMTAGDFKRAIQEGMGGRGDPLRGSSFRPTRPEGDDRTIPRSDHPAELNQGNETDALERVKQAKIRAASDLEGLIKSVNTELDFIDKELKKSMMGRTDKLKALSKKTQLFEKLVGELTSSRDEFVGKLMQGGLTQAEWMGIIKMTKEACKGNTEQAAKEVEKVRKQIEGLKGYGGLALEKLAGDIVDNLKITGDKCLEHMSDMAGVALRTKQEMDLKLQDMKIRGVKGWRMAAAKMQAAMKHNGGSGMFVEGAEALRQQERHNTGVGALSKVTGAGNFMGRYVTDEGKFDKAEFYKGMLDKLQKVAETGFSAYRETGRQFGGENRGMGEIYSAYQDMSAQYNKVGLKTGYSAEETAKNHRIISDAIRDTSSSLEERSAVQLKSTETAQKYSWALGMEVSKITAVAKAYRLYQGVNSKDAVKTAASAMQSMMEDINHTVSGDLKVSSDDVAERMKEIAEEAQKSGIGMKAFSEYTQQSMVYADKLGMTYARAWDMAKKLSDLQAGKTTTAGESVESLALNGTLDKIRLGSNSVLGGVNANQNTMGFRKDMISALEASGLQKKDVDETKNIVDNPAVQAEMLTMLQAMKTGKLLAWSASTENGGAKIAQYTKQLATTEGGRRLLGNTNVNDIFRENAQKSNYGGDWMKAMLVRRAKGETGEQASLEMNQAEQNDTNTQIKKETKDQKKETEEEHQKRLEAEAESSNNTGAAITALIHPMEAFSKACNMFVGSVNMFGIIMGAKAGLDIVDSMGGLGKLGGLGKGLVGKLMGKGAAGVMERGAIGVAENLAPKALTPAAQYVADLALSTGGAGAGGAGLTAATGELTAAATELTASTTGLTAAATTIPEALAPEVAAGGLGAAATTAASAAGIAAAIAAMADIGYGATRGMVHATQQSDYFESKHAGEATAEDTQKMFSSETGFWGKIGAGIGLLADLAEESYRQQGNELKGGDYISEKAYQTGVKASSGKTPDTGATKDPNKEYLATKDPNSSDLLIRIKGEDIGKTSLNTLVRQYKDAGVG
jgi:hypothetical protein